MNPLKISAYTLTNALGHGREASLAALRLGRSGLRACDLPEAPLSTWIGRVEGVESVILPAALAGFDCRNNRLALLGLEQDGFVGAVSNAAARYGAERVAVFAGTSTSGIAETEAAYRDLADERLPASFNYYKSHSLYSLAEFSRRLLGLAGPALTVSTACSSSAKIFAMAHRYISMGLCDAAVVVGVDSLCLTTLYGFRSLELVSSDPCRPWDENRNGISIGEGAGFALLERAEPGEAALSLCGYGESSDAYHMSTPHPQGLGAAMAMRQALERAALQPAQIDYLNLHGTSTPANDVSEDAAVLIALGDRTACSSTKGATGHTLGAAGITEALICCLSIEQGFIPGSVNTLQLDLALRARIIRQTQNQPVRYAMTNSLGFGGSNCSLVFGIPA